MIHLAEMLPCAFALILVSIMQDHDRINSFTAQIDVDKPISLLVLNWYLFLSDAPVHDASMDAAHQPGPLFQANDFFRVSTSCCLLFSKLFPTVNFLWSAPIQHVRVTVRIEEFFCFLAATPTSTVCDDWSVLSNTWQIHFFFCSIVNQMPRLRTTSTRGETRNANAFLVARLNRCVRIPNINHKEALAR
mmetsp:Transcript_9860/g.29320  ORF Transcript_9860/g.29320 Transcript_9860/m.29320 type:complete len:190 (-) Transcript_9860:156-725(-)